jgi:hypothetical protein
MTVNVTLTSPDGEAVYASPDGAAALVEQCGYRWPDEIPAPVEPEPTGDGPDRDTTTAPGPPAGGSDDRPKGNASRSDWADYAMTRGLDVAADQTRDDIRAAVEALDA